MLPCAKNTPLLTLHAVLSQHSGCCRSEGTAASRVGQGFDVDLTCRAMTFDAGNPDCRILCACKTGCKHNQAFSLKWIVREKQTHQTLATCNLPYGCATRNWVVFLRTQASPRSYLDPRFLNGLDNPVIEMITAPSSGIQC